MSDNATDAAVEKDIETVSSDEKVVDVHMDQGTNDDTVNMEPTCKQADVQEDKPQKEVSLKDILLFAQNNIFTPKVCNIILLSLGIIITALCMIQMVFWGLSIKNTYSNYWESIKTLDFINIGVMVFMVLFVLVLLVNIIIGIVSLIKKGHETRFETVSTMFAFSIFSMFVTKLFDGHDLLISNVSFSPILKILIILTIVYAFVRLFVKDFAARICPFAFSCGAIVLAIVMFSQDVGNFATYTIDDSVRFNLVDLNIYKYMQSAIGFETSAEATSGIDSLFFEYGNEIKLSGIDLDETIVVILLQFVPIMVANVLPYAAISLLGYLIYGLVGSNYTQYYNLQFCKKISVTMLVVSVLSLIATIGLHLICKATNLCSIAVQVNYANAIATILICVLLIVVTFLPWKIYNVIYKHRYAAYQKSKGGN